MSTPSTVETPSMDEHEEMEREDHFDSSSSQIHDSSKEGECDESTTKPKRTRKSTQRFLETFMDEELTFGHKIKKKKPAPKKMDEGGECHVDGDLPNEEHNEPSGSHENVTEETEKRSKIAPGKVQCTFMESKKKSNSQCKQRAIEGFLFCIWHILNDTQAPYRRCAHMRQVVKKDGVERKVQCKTAIKLSWNPPLCLAHSDRKRKRKRESQPDGVGSPSSPTKGESPVVNVSSLNKSSPSSPSSSIFNLRNEEFAMDIDEAIDNMGNMDDLMGAFDEFESLEDEEKKEEKVKEKGSRLPFQVDEELSKNERELMDDLISPLFIIGQKLIERITKMRQTFKCSRDFWSASLLHPEIPPTPQKYKEQFMTERLMEKMNIPVARKEEIRNMIIDSELNKEINQLHEYNVDLIREVITLQRCMVNMGGQE